MPLYEPVNISALPRVEVLGVDRLVEDLWGQVAFRTLDLGMRTYDVIRTGAYLIQL